MGLGPLYSFLLSSVLIQNVRTLNLEKEYLLQCILSINASIVGRSRFFTDYIEKFNIFIERETSFQGTKLFFEYYILTLLRIMFILK
jgi:hypothetical protein